MGASLDAAREKGGPEGPPLVNTEIKSASPPEGGRLSFSRRERLRMRSALWWLSKIPDLRKCGRVRRDLSLRIVDTENGPRMLGLCRCHSVWACPVCAVEIRAARGREISRALFDTLALGFGVGFGSLTVPHGLGHSLDESLSVVLKAWRHANDTRAVRQFKKAHGYLGFVRTVEITYGSDNGWHPHIHYLDFWKSPLSDALRAEYAGLVLHGWQASVVRQGFRRPSDEHGHVLREVTTQAVGDYLTKCEPKWAGLELTSISTKTALRGRLGPFDLLWIAVDRHLPWAWELWWEYELATRGRRMLGWSRGMRQALGVAEAEPDPEAEPNRLLAYVDREQHDALRRADVWCGVVQYDLEQAALEGGQVSVDECIRVLLGGVVTPTQELRGDEQLLLLTGAGEVGF